jgi:hypothetical protein
VAVLLPQTEVTEAVAVLLPQTEVTEADFGFLAYVFPKKKWV